MCRKHHRCNMVVNGLLERYGSRVVDTKNLKPRSDGSRLKNPCRAVDRSSEFIIFRSVKYRRLEITGTVIKKWESHYNEPIYTVIILSSPIRWKAAQFFLKWHLIQKSPEPTFHQLRTLVRAMASTIKRLSDLITIFKH
jgi:hypothetical protein